MSKVVKWWLFRLSQILKIKITLIPWAINPRHKNWKWAWKTKFYQKYPTRFNFILFVVYINQY